MSKTAAYLRVGFLLAMAACPMTVAAQGAAVPTYDVVSIKPDKTASGSWNMDINDGVFLANNVSLKTLILSAYKLQTDRQLSGLPGWASSARFDIEAKMDADEIAALKKMKSEARDEQQLVMMQAVLADRFQLKIHHEKKMLAAYALIVLKNGVKFKESNLKNVHSGSMDIHNQKLTATAMTMDDFVRMLSGQVQREVVNKTGLTSRYDFTMQWSRDDMPEDLKATTGVDSWPSIYTALQEQLGLKLESTKAPVDTIVVDHVEEPSAN